MKRKREKISVENILQVNAGLSDWRPGTQTVSNEDYLRIAKIAFFDPAEIPELADYISRTGLEL